jgi:hypothetical protein
MEQTQKDDDTKDCQMADNLSRWIHWCRLDQSSSFFWINLLERDDKRILIIEYPKILVVGDLEGIRIVIGVANGGTSSTVPSFDNHFFLLFCVGSSLWPTINKTFFSIF